MSQDLAPTPARGTATAPHAAHSTSAAACHPLPPRCRELLAQAQQQWDRQQGLCVFAYGSLIWRPEFPVASRQRARVHGFHRTLGLRSLVNRGTPECPGLVLSLVAGGSCQGMLYRVPVADSATALEGLWAREMVVGSYTPRWLDCMTETGTVRALAFTLSRHNPGYVRTENDAALLHVLRHARGRYGSTLDYLRQTVFTLREHGIPDPKLEQHWAWAEAHGLADLA